MNNLFFGDNLDVLREYIETESIDLIYLDPPFNSQARYNVLFESPVEARASAQVEAFRDTWTWGEEAEADYSEVMSVAGPTARFAQALRSALGESDMMAYLTMMALRLHELRRVLKPNGTLYLHCDPTASHYLKVLLDGVYDPQRFHSEIVWQRTNAKSHAVRRFSAAHDVILVFQKGEEATWNPVYVPHSATYIKSHYANIEPETGRRFTLGDCTNPNPDRPNLTYEWKGLTRVWRWTREKMDELDRQGRLVYTKTGMPRYKRYLDEMPGTPVTDVWTDIPPLNSQARERIGYPTQKPLALLRRIIEASSNPGDVVLDPFCGCGTSIHAAQEMERQWIGIDIAYYAIRVIHKRMFDELEYEIADKDIQGLPRDLEQAKALADRDKYQFQWWANSVVGVQQFREIKKGADRGIDGEYYFANGPRPVGRVLTSVKGGKNINVSMVRDFRGTVEREGADMGMFVCLGRPTQPMITEAAAAGFVRTVHGQFPRIQIYSIEEYFDGQTARLPPLLRVSEDSFSTRRRRTKTKRPDPDQPQLVLPFTGGKADKKAGVVRHINPDILVAAE